MIFAFALELPMEIADLPDKQRDTGSGGSELDPALQSGEPSDGEEAGGCDEAVGIHK